MTREVESTGLCEPSRAELDRIEAEWPVIAAELELVGAECLLARAPGDAVARRAHRRAVRALLAALLRGSSTHHDVATGTRLDAA